MARFQRKFRPAARNYLKSMHSGRIGGSLSSAGRALGRLGGAVGRDLMRGGDAYSVRKRMGKAGFKKIYRHYGRERWARPGEDIAKLIRNSKTPYWKKKLLMQEALNLDQKAESQKMSKVVQEEVLAKSEELRKDPKLAKMWIDTVEKNILAGGRLSGGRHVEGKQIEDIARGTSGVPREVAEYLAAAYRGLDQHQEVNENKQTTQAEFAQRLKELGSKGVIKESDIQAVERGLDVEQFGQQKEQTHMRNSSAIERLRASRGTVVGPDSSGSSSSGGRGSSLQQKQGSLNK